MENKNKIILPLAGIFICAISFFIGIYVGSVGRPVSEKIYGITGKDVPQEILADFSPFWNAWKILDEKYAFPSTTTSSTTIAENRIWGAIQGLTNSFNDPYTVFFPPEEAKSFEEDVSGSFQGVGMEIGMKDKALTVVSPLKNSPAQRAGVMPGDKILKIDELVSVDLPVEKAVKLIRGKQGTTVKLLLSRVNVKDPFIISIVRDVIIAPTVETENKDGIFVIKLYGFTQTAPALFRDALKEFIDSGNTKLILDLRGNPGGYLDVSVDIASWFLPLGKVVVKEDFGSQKGEDMYRSRGYDIFNDNLKLAILVNGGSASASEILAGALRDYGKGKLIGEKTFGKGSVQEVIKLTDTTSLKVTVAKWFTPNGISINEKGLEPDIKVEMTIKDIEKGIDPQMNKAIEYLNGEN